MSEALYLSVGGKRAASTVSMAGEAGEDTWDFGWVPPHERDDEQNEAHERAERGMSTASVLSTENDDAEYANLTRFWNHPAVATALGFPYTGTHQLTGSCLPAGQMVLMADGTRKPIEEVVIGDQVISNRDRKRRVARTFQRLFTGDLISLDVADLSRPVIVTEDHQIPVPGSDPEYPNGFLDCRADRFSSGDKVLIRSHEEGGGRHSQVTGVRRSPVETLRVFDIEVQDDHYFFAGDGLLVHNCVGAGAGNMANTLNFVEVLLFGDLEKLFLCFYPFHYGRGRLKSGMRGRGEGSSGSGQAEALKEDGVMDNALYGLPKPTSTSDGIVWGSAVEMKWSDGSAVPADVLAEGRKHVITDVAKMNNSDDVRKAIVSGKPVTCASMYAHNGGRVQGEGKDACLLASKSGSWSHQMSILAAWKHPKFGWIFYLMNQWGLSAHGTCPTGMPRGGVWITAADVDWICQRGGETYAYAGHSGWASGAIDWSRI